MNDGWKTKAFSTQPNFDSLPSGTFFKIKLIYFNYQFMRTEKFHDEKRIYPVTKEKVVIGEPTLFPLRPETELRIATLDLGESRSKSSVTALDSPEAKSLIGSLECRGGDYVFVPGRLHLGALREIDTKVAIFQMMRLPKFGEILGSYSGDQAIMVSILREGMLLDLGPNLLLAQDFRPQDQVTISVYHIEDEARGHLGLRSEVDYYRHETTPEQARKIKLAIVGDSIAGGRNILTMMERINQDFPNLESLVVISIHASLKGMDRILAGLPENVRQCQFFCLNGALAASLTNHYDCYWPIHRPDSLSDPRDTRLMELIYGPRVCGQICVGGNWTANYLTPAVAIQVLEEQLATFGLSVDQIPKTEIDKTVLNQLGYSQAELTPYSTLLMNTKGLSSIK